MRVFVLLIKTDLDGNNSVIILFINLFLYCTSSGIEIDVTTYDDIDDDESDHPIEIDSETDVKHDHAENSEANLAST